MSSERSLFALGEVRRVREPPDDMEQVLWRVAPQALLRDLHRPVQGFILSPIDFERTGVLLDAAKGATLAARRLRQASYRIPIRDLLQTSRMGLAAYREIKATLRKPWADAPKFGKMYMGDGYSRLR